MLILAATAAAVAAASRPIATWKSARWARWGASGLLTGWLLLAVGWNIACAAEGETLKKQTLIATAMLACVLSCATGNVTISIAALYAVAWTPLDGSVHIALGMCCLAVMISTARLTFAERIRTSI